jgi:hypothetical protein
VPSLLVEFHGPSRFVAMVRQRCVHATHLGETRVRDRGESPLALTLRAPAVPFLLTARALRRAIPNPWGRAAIARGVIPLLIYSVAWAVGEVVGAWRARRRSGRT